MLLFSALGCASKLDPQVFDGPRSAPYISVRARMTYDGALSCFINRFMFFHPTVFQPQGSEA